MGGGFLKSSPAKKPDISAKHPIPTTPTTPIHPLPTSPAPSLPTYVPQKDNNENDLTNNDYCILTMSREEADKVLREIKEVR